MILRDENIPENQRLALSSWKPLQVGLDRWSKGSEDDQIAVRLRSERNVTFFTRDRDFYNRRHEYGHANSAIVFVDCPAVRFASLADRLLRHPSFRTHSSRMGAVFKLSETSIVRWLVSDRTQTEIPW